MTEQKNIQVVQQLLAALKRGNIPGVLDKLADEVQWRAWGPAAARPGPETVCGKAQVEEFLAKLTSAGEVQGFEPQEFVAQGEQVLVLGQANQASPSQGRPIRLDWVMVFELYDHKIIRYQYCDDLVVAME